MNILFICTANRDRSRTAEIHFQNKYPEHRFRSAGINKYLSERHGGVHLKQYMLDHADEIICMEMDHIQHLNNYYSDECNAKIQILNLGDTETFMTDSLIKKLEEKMSSLGYDFTTKS